MSRSPRLGVVAEGPKGLETDRVLHPDRFDHVEAVPMYDSIG